MSRCLTLVMLVHILSACAAASDDSVLANPSFDRWCAGVLCAWESQGAVVQTDTWHKDDLAVSFEGPGAQISQLVDDNSAACFLFDTIADLDPMAQLKLYIDFDDDGLFEVDQTLTGVDWKSITFSYPPPETYASVRFTVRKQGTGRAVLAQLRVERAPACPAAPFTPSEPTE